MAATYSGNPATSALDEVRFLIGDTNMADPQLTDAEIAYGIALNLNSVGGRLTAAANLAELIAAKYARMFDSKSVGDLSISYSSRAQQYATMAADLRRRATLAGVPFYAGGISHTDKKSNELNTDRIQTAIKIDGMSLIASRPDDTREP